jgi:steroid delta-isomerase-like uncharacterized protein
VPTTPPGIRTWRLTTSDRALVATAVAVVMWSLGSLFIAALHGDRAVLAVARVWLAVGIGLVMLRRRGESLTGASLKSAFVPGTLFAISNAASFVALERTSVANFTLILALQPCVVAVVAGRLFGESLSRTQVLAMAVAVVGVATVVVGSHSIGPTRSGDLLAVVNLLAFTAFFLLGKRLRVGGVDHRTYLTSMFVVSSGWLMLWLVVGHHSYSIDTRDLWILAATAASGAIGHASMSWSQRYVPATLAATMLVAQPVIAGGAAWLFLRQSLGPSQVVGSLVAVAAIVVFIATSNRKEPLMSMDLRQVREEIVRRHVDAENSRDVEAALQTFHHPRYEIMATGRIIDGADDVRAFVAVFVAALPNIRSEVERIHHADDAVIVEYRTIGRHDGDWAGIRATGAAIDSPAIALFLFDEDRLVAERIYRDTRSLERQMQGEPA